MVRQQVTSEPISKDDVVAYFNAFLGREPENDKVIELFQKCKNLSDLATALASSEEFRLRTGLSFQNEIMSLDRIYHVIYGVDLDSAERARLNSHGITDKIINSQIIRRIIGATDRQVRPTPFLVRFDPLDIAYVSFGGFELAVDIADLAVGSAMKIENKYEPYLTSLFQRSIKKGMTVVDVGANIGYYSMLAASLVGKAGKVISIEPNSENARLLLLSRNKNKFDHVNLVPIALSTKTGSAFFSSHVGSNGGLMPTSEDILLNSQCTVVPTMAMDDVVTGHVDFIKVDTEGAEGLILTGASRIIERDRPIISSEFSPEMLTRISKIPPLGLLELFKARGYRVLQLDRLGSDSELEILDIEQFVRGYGDERRISEIVFRPN